MVVCWCILSMCCSVLFCCRKCQPAACVFHEFWEVIWDILHVSATIVLLHLTFQFFNAYSFVPDISSVSALLLSHYASSLCILISVQATIMPESSLWCATVLEWPKALSFPTSFPLKHFCHCYCHQVYSPYSKSTSCHWEWLHLWQWIWIQQHDTIGMLPCICKLLGTDQFAIMVSGWNQRTPFFWQLRSRISTWSKAS